MRKFLVDVNVPKDIWLLLKEKKLPFRCVHDMNREMSDADVAAMAVKESLVLITCDKDFVGYHHAFPELNIIIFDAIGQSVENKVFALEQFLNRLEDDPLMAIGCTMLKC